MRPSMRLAVAAALAALVALPASSRAAELRIGLTQAQAGEARKFQPLVEYLASKGVSASFVTAPDYRAAADLFASGKVDAMFGGSGVTGTLIIKELARPVLRPVSLDGVSTYAAVVIAPNGAPRFDGTARYFDGKRVIFAPIATAGEFFFRALGPSKAAGVLKAASHGAALDALGRGQADVAIIKNHVWTKEKDKFPGLTQVGGDPGENPDTSLIVSTKLDPGTVKQLGNILLGVEKDAGAAAVRDAMKIRGFVPTSEKEYAHTLDLLRKAGVTREFAFAFPN